MTAERPASSSAAHAAQRVGSGIARSGRAFTILNREQRMAALAAIGLFVSLFLPWYQETLVVAGKSRPQAATASLTGWAAFSFVEAAVLLVAVAVLALLFNRAEGKAFHVPGGDGGVITAAGLWTCALIIWRVFDKQGTSTHGASVAASGIEWGIFVTLAVSAFLAYSGFVIRAAHRPEPPLPGEPGGPGAPGGTSDAVGEPSWDADPGPADHERAATQHHGQDTGEQLTIPLSGDEGG
jgi:hypothetical protein